MRSRAGLRESVELNYAGISEGGREKERAVRACLRVTKRERITDSETDRREYAGIAVGF